MTSYYKTEQEAFWAGEFGDKYTDRNKGAQIVAGNIALFSKILKNMTLPRSVIEFGANTGLNLHALKQLLPKAEFTALEINTKAIETLKRIELVTPVHTSILDFIPEKTFDLTLIKGVLIHINPGELPAVYERLYKSTGKYLVIAEYYNPTPIAVPYRGHEDRLFKRDFAGEIIDTYSDMKLVDYGFSYHRDPAFPQDDFNWFLLEKQ